MSALKNKKNSSRAKCNFSCSTKVQSSLKSSATKSKVPMLSRRTHAIFYSQKQVILFSFFIYRKQKHNNVSGSSFRNPTSSPHLIDFLLFILVLIRNNTLNLYFTHTHSTQQQPSSLCSAADINRRKDRTRALLSLIRESIKFCCEKCDPDFWRWKPDWDIMC